MGRGTNLAEGIAIDEGVSPHEVRTILRFAGETLVIETSQDMTRILEHVQQMRERNAGRRWGDGLEVGHIPELFYMRIARILDKRERKREVRRFFRENPAFCAYPPYLKD